jgi:hypothetical protein
MIFQLKIDSDSHYDFGQKIFITIYGITSNTNNLGNKKFYKFKFVMNKFT